MTSNRIQKLLFSEYADFEDMVLVESPFAQTTREGQGLRQVHIGLTPSKLILAADCLVGGESVVTSGVDPEIESLELISLFPVECVNISVFRRRTRNTLKAHFCNNQVLYFELAATQSRQMLWNLWMERVRFLCPEDKGSAQSETSVGSSTSSSTQYCKHPNKTANAMPYQARDHLVYTFTSSYSDAPISEVSKQNSSRQIFCLKHRKYSSHSLRSSRSNSRHRADMTRCGSMLVCCSSGRADCCLVNRFGHGVAENCNMGLYLPGSSYRIKPKGSGSAQDVSECVDEEGKNAEVQRKHHRRYGIMPLPHLLFGMGPWTPSKPQTFTLQAKEVMSEVQIRRPKSEEFRLTLTKRELTSTISCEALYVDRDSTHALPATNKLNLPSDPPILFWTKDYWYRPRSARTVYNDIINHLHLLYDFQNQKNGKKRGCLWKFRRKKNRLSDEMVVDDQSQSCKEVVLSSTSSSNGMLELKRSLRMELGLKIWDFDSNIIAYELTLIERDLFLKMRASEVVTLVQEKSSKNTPHIASIIAFSNRIMNLVATEIVNIEDLKTRVRLMARFINVVNKLHGLHNMQSARSVLLGLQATSVYRMKKTWTYLRQHHSTKYQRLMFLLRLHKDPRTVVYKAMFQSMTCTPPYIPSVFYMVAYLLGKVTSKETINLPKAVREELKARTRMVSKEKVAMIKKQPLRYFMSSLRLCDSSDDASSNGEEFSILGVRSSETSRTSSVRVERLMSLLWMPMCSCLEVGDAGWARLERLAALSDALNTWQKSAAQYALVDNPLAREYLLKARYLEDAELFYMSLKIEN